MRKDNTIIGVTAATVYPSRIIITIPITIVVITMVVIQINQKNKISRLYQYRFV